MAYQGQATGYYNSQNIDQSYQPPPGPPQGYQPYAPPPGPSQGYQQPSQPEYQQPPSNEPQYGAQEPKYPQQPPTYGENFNPPQDDKQTFQDTFKIPKPKFHDLWAGLLVRTAGR